MLVICDGTAPFRLYCCVYPGGSVMFIRPVLALSIFRLSLRDNLIKWVRCPSVVRTSVRRTYVRPLTFHKNIFSSESTGPIRTKFGMTHQGNEALSVCAPRLDPPLQRVLGDELPPNPTFSLKIFLSETAGPNALELIWGLLEHV